MTELNFTQKEHQRHLQTLSDNGALSEPVFASGVGLSTETCNQLVDMRCLALSRDGRRYLYRLLPDGDTYLDELYSGKINDYQAIGESIETCARSLMSGNDGAYYAALLHLMRARSSLSVVSPEQAEALDSIERHFEQDKEAGGKATQSRRSAAHFAVLYSLLEDVTAAGIRQVVDATLDSKTATQYKGAKMTPLDLSNIEALDRYFTRMTGKKPPQAFIYSAALLTLTILLEATREADNEDN